MFRRNVSPPTSGWNNPRAVNKCEQLAADWCSQLHPSSTQRHIPEDNILHSHRCTTCFDLTWSSSGNIIFLFMYGLYFLAFSRFPFQSYILPNDTSKPTFNAISHELHAQIVNCKPSPSHSTQNLIYKHQNINITHSINMMH
jgi:hypothetical protein